MASVRCQMVGQWTQNHISSYCGFLDNPLRFPCRYCTPLNSPVLSIALLCFCFHACFAFIACFHCFSLLCFHRSACSSTSTSQHPHSQEARLCFDIEVTGRDPYNLFYLQIAFKTSTERHSFQLTREAHEIALQRDCSQPCDRVNVCNGSGIDATQDALLAEYELCDVCGMSGGRPDSSRGSMEVCGCCLDHEKETLVCSSCIPGQLRRCLHAHPDNRHWRCQCCRSVPAIQLACGYESVSFCMQSCVQ